MKAEIDAKMKKIAILHDKKVELDKEKEMLEL